MKLFNLVLIVLVATSFSRWYSNADDNNDSYIGAVVDFAPVDFTYDVLNKTTAQLYMLENLQYFDEHTKEAKRNGAQIILFSEYGVCGSWTTITDRKSFSYYLETIPDPKNQSVVACGNQEYADRPIFTKLSCIAKENSIYLVVDYTDLQLCDIQTDKNCPSDGQYQYNAELAFSPDGTLLAKYYKTHLFDEAKFADYPPVADPVYFDTDFGVRFGMFICFDLLFKYPQTDLIEKYGVQNILYSTEWINNNLMLATSIQQGWSYYNGLNILASNSGSGNDESGSGIYSNGQVLAYTINTSEDPKSTLLVSKVPKSPLSSNKSYTKYSKTIPLNQQNAGKKYYSKISNEQNLTQLNDDYITPNDRLNIGDIPFTAAPFQLVANKEQTVQAINNGLTCTFTFTSPSTKDQLLALIAYNGDLQNDPREEIIHIQVCSVFICSGSTIDSCSDLVFDSDISLSKFSLHGTFSNGYRIYPMLNVLPFEKVGIYNETTQTLYASGIEKYKFIGTSFFNPKWEGQTRATNLN